MSALQARGGVVLAIDVGTSRIALAVADLADNLLVTPRGGKPVLDRSVPRRTARERPMGVSRPVEMWTTRGGSPSAEHWPAVDPVCLKGALPWRCGRGSA